MQFTQREFLLLEDAIEAQKLAISKFQNAATHFRDAQLKQMCQKMAQKHQQHFNTLLGCLERAQGQQSFGQYGAYGSVSQPYYTQNYTQTGSGSSASTFHPGPATYNQPGQTYGGPTPSFGGPTH